jgi:hypothetical protein
LNNLKRLEVKNSFENIFNRDSIYSKTQQNLDTREYLQSSFISAYKFKHEDRMTISGPASRSCFSARLSGHISLCMKTEYFLKTIRLENFVILRLSESYLFEI